MNNDQIDDELPKVSWDEEYMREQAYWNNLAQFEGVEGIYYGFMDELNDMEKLIDVLGISIVKEEEEFRKIEQEEYEPENPFTSERLLAVWHKKAYRQFTYRAMFMLIHSLFENGLTTLYSILLEERRINGPQTNNNLIDTLKELRKLDSVIADHISQAKAFNFIRNKITHTDGYCKRNDSCFQDTKRFITGRIDISLSELKTKKEKFTHRVQVSRSSLLKDYLNFIKTIFQSLLNAAASAPYISLAK